MGETSVMEPVAEEAEDEFGESGWAAGWNAGYREGVADTYAPGTDPALTAALARVETAEHDRDEWRERAMSREQECEARARKQWDAEAERDALLASVEALERALATAAEDERDRLYEKALADGPRGYVVTDGRTAGWATATRFWLDDQGAMFPDARAALRASTVPEGGER